MKSIEAMSGESLVVTAALLAVQVGQGRSAQQLAVLAAFFTSFADNLALLAGQLPQNETNAAADGGVQESEGFSG